MGRFELSEAEWAIIEPLLAGRRRTSRSGAPDRTIDGCSTRSSSCYAPAHRGAICRNGMAHRPRPTTGSIAGRSEVYGCRIFEALSCRISQLACVNRQLDHPRPPARRRRKKGGPDHAIGRSRGGLSTKINALVGSTRPAGPPGPHRRAGPRPGRGSRICSGGRSRLVPTLWPIGVTTSPPSSPTSTAAGATAAHPDDPAQADRRGASIPYSIANATSSNAASTASNTSVRIATRYDKLAQNYLSAVALAAIRLWMRFELHELTLRWCRAYQPLRFILRQGRPDAIMRPE